MSLIDSASLIVTPNAYKEGKLYSVIPSDGSGDMSVVRATTATRVNSAGLVELVPYNLLEYSEQFNNAIYNKYNNITATADQATAPNGTITADTIGLSTASTTFPNLGQESQYIQGTVYTFSVYLKKNTINFGKIRIGGTAFASSTNSPLVNLNTGVIVSGTGTIESVGNGWYRCTMTATAEATAYGGFAIDLPDSTGVWNASSVYNVNDSIFAWGAQVNEGSTALPYQKTETRLNIPRLDYSNGTCPSLLVEPQRTNLLTYSSSFDNAAWFKLNATITANNTTSPSGIQDADAIVDDATNGVHITYLFVNKTTGNSWTCYMKKGTLDYGYISAVQSAALFTTCIINLTNGAIHELQNGSSTTGTVTTEDVGNGWYRVKMQTNVLNAGCSFGTSDGSALSGATKQAIYTGTGSGTIYLWGAQSEDATYSTSYIPTTSASVTRNADVISKTGISSLIGQTEGVIFIDAYRTQKSVNYQALIGLGNGTSSSQMMEFFYNSSNELTVGVYNSGQQFVNNTVIANGRHKIALAYKANDFALYIDGVLIASDTSGTVPTMNQLNIGEFNYTSGYAYADGINAVALWQTRLTNTQLAALTTI